MVPRPAGLVARPQTVPVVGSKTVTPVVAGDATVAPTPLVSVPPQASATPPMSVAGSGGAARSPAATITAAPTPQPLVNLRLNSPAGQFTYSIKATTVTDACNILTAAHDQGLIKTVTIDDSYRAVLKSAYVREINGYYNNWTFKVNGVSPKGCSLASVKTGDTVLWEYQ